MNAGLVWRVLRAEGAAGVADRLRDRLAEARRRRSFRPAAAAPPGFRAAVLNLAAAAPAPRLGGVQAQLLWRLEAEAALRPVALLYPEPAAAGGGHRLELQDGTMRRALYLPPATGGARPAGAGPPRHVGGLAPAAAASPGPEAREPLPAMALDDPGLERAVRWAAAQCGAAALAVEGLAGMPLASLLRLSRAGTALVLAVHDFAAFCPRPHLLEAAAPPPARTPPSFCHYSRDAERCARCLGRSAPRLEPGYQEGRREVARRLLASAAAVVYPSSFLARAHGELFAGAGGAAARVIAPAGSCARGVPGSSLPRSGSPAAAWPRSAPPASGPPTLRAPRSPRHIAWVGAVQPHKGALVFEAAVRRLAAAGRHPRLSAYGGGDPEILARWRRLPGLRVRGYYRAGSLPALLGRDRVDLALLLSVVPESYGLVLDECAAAGVPVVAFDLGAPAERIAAAGSGLLLAAPLADDPAAGGSALATLIADLLDGRLDAPPPAAALPAPAITPSRPPGLAVAATAAAAASAWGRLYGELGLLTDQKGYLR
ncbi:MAG TPA: glycosyltransferase [Thermoanaerobaculia bacterium]|nr:glycosyltransferase [Thermoanaerobaculia bacterium]